MAAILLLSAEAAAQAKSPPAFHVPSWEVAAQLGGEVLGNGRSFAGARFTRNAKSWLAWEVAADRGFSEDSVPQRPLLVVNARAGGPDDSNGCRPDDCKRVYFSAGIGVGSAVDRGVSPMLGLGLQTPWAEPIAFRGDLQFFTRGSDDYIRLVIGVVIGIDRRD